MSAGGLFQKLEISWQSMNLGNSGNLESSAMRGAYLSDEALRLLERQISRQCLSEALEALGGGLGILSSLTHTQGLTLALALKVDAESPCLGVGIDAERLDRAISEGAERRIRIPGEVELSTLKLWTIKEACFKADPSPLKQVVTQYRLDTWEESQKTGLAMGPRADVFFEVRLEEQEDWVIAFARCLRT